MELVLGQESLKLGWSTLNQSFHHQNFPLSSSAALLFHQPPMPVPLLYGSSTQSYTPHLTPHSSFPTTSPPFPTLLPLPSVILPLNSFPDLLPSPTLLPPSFDPMLPYSSPPLPPPYLPPILTLLALSLHIQYISHQSLKTSTPSHMPLKTSLHHFPLFPSSLYRLCGATYRSRWQTLHLAPSTKLFGTVYQKQPPYKEHVRIIIII